MITLPMRSHPLYGVMIFKVLASSATVRWFENRRIKLKNITLEYAASLLRTQHKEVRTMTRWLGIRTKQTLALRNIINCTRHNSWKNVLFGAKQQSHPHSYYIDLVWISDWLIDWCLTLSEQYFRSNCILRTRTNVQTPERAVYKKDLKIPKR